MATIETAQAGRINAQLDKLWNIRGKAMSMRQFIEENKNDLQLTETDGMIDYSRTKFNRMDYKEQEKYMSMLKGRKYYFINDIKVAKLVYDFAKAFERLL